MAGIAKQYSMTPELVWALNAGSDPIGHLPDAELTDTALHHKTMPLADTAAHAASRYLVPHRRGGAFKLMPLNPPPPPLSSLPPAPRHAHTHEQFAFHRVCAVGLRLLLLLLLFSAPQLGAGGLVTTGLRFPVISKGGSQPNGR